MSDATFVVERHFDVAIEENRDEASGYFVVSVDDKRGLLLRETYVDVR